VKTAGKKVFFFSASPLSPFFSFFPTFYTLSALPSSLSLPFSLFFFFASPIPRHFLSLLYVLLPTLLFSLSLFLSSFLTLHLPPTFSLSLIALSLSSLFLPPSFNKSLFLSYYLPIIFFTSLHLLLFYFSLAFQSTKPLLLVLFSPNSVTLSFLFLSPLSPIP
jgi:hypothetical protein